MSVLLREDEATSKPLSVGCRPELPGLRGNSFWQSLITTHRPYSGRGYLTVILYAREQELLMEIIAEGPGAADGNIGAGADDGNDGAGAAVYNNRAGAAATSAPNLK